MKHSIRAEDLNIQTLGACEIPSPMQNWCGEDFRFINDTDRVVFETETRIIQNAVREDREIPSLELAGPRKNIFFQPENLNCAIVTCGGLCPGLNDVIRGLVMQLHHRYGVRGKIYGVRYGYRGFIKKYNLPPMELTPETVVDIQTLGGSILGMSRGNQDLNEIVDWLESHQVGILFVIGGDGTLKAAGQICELIRQRNLNISLVGIPKTIDNDIMYLDKSFGFETAFSEAVEAIRCAHVEANGVPNGIGLVKLMGRESGFIASHAALAIGHANYVLIPEIPFELHGENGLLAQLKRRLAYRDHAVIVVAEGAGQNLFENNPTERDASGNVKFHDIGVFLKKQIEQFFEEEKIEVHVKYIDPSYIIRGIPATPRDSIFCARLAQHAVHAGMAGKTAVLIGRWNMDFVHLPIPLVTQGRNHIDRHSDLWLSVLESTGQDCG